MAKHGLKVVAVDDHRNRKFKGFNSDQSNTFPAVEISKSLLKRNHNWKFKKLIYIIYILKRVQL